MLSAVKLLVTEFRADVNFKDNHATPLHYACSNGNLDIIKFLIERGADVSAKDGDGTYFSHFLPLHKPLL